MYEVRMRRQWKVNKKGFGKEWRDNKNKLKMLFIGIVSELEKKGKDWEGNWKGIAKRNT